MWQVPLGSVNRILCLGAHSDDIEIGAGGTLLKLVSQVPDLEIQWVVFSAPGPRADEARRSAEEFLVGVPRKQVIIGSFRESYFPSEWVSIKDWFEGVKAKFDPDLVFTHYRDDRHQDHRVLSDLAWNTFRNHLILEYEILKYDGDLGNPNFFVPRLDFFALSSWTYIYNTAPLRTTLAQLVDLEALANPKASPGLLVTATDIAAGQIAECSDLVN